MMTIRFSLTLFTCLLNLLASCRQGQSIVGVSNPQTQIKVDTLITKLKNPWGGAFLPDGDMLFTERSGILYRWNPQTKALTPLEGFPQTEVFANGQGGLLDVQLHPDFANNQLIYFSMSRKVDDGGHTALYRAKLSGNKLSDVQLLFQAQPAGREGFHFGSRIAFDENNFVFMSMGDRGRQDEAQKLSSHNGTIIRLHDDGRVPADNPFVGTANALPEIWSYGHRNVQGMIYDKATRTLWAHEHGAKGGDELNIVEKGKNYGWPVITYGVNYNGTPISNLTAKEGMEQPVKYWVPSIAPCGMAMVNSDKYPESWQNNILIGALAMRHIARLEMKEQKVVNEEKLVEGMARIRWIGQGPDGYIYVLSEGPGMLFRLRYDSN
ncbi:PQQ-dependent sugar dehydrogenase [Rhodoflexus sp.]